MSFPVSDKSKKLSWFSKFPYFSENKSSRLIEETTPLRLHETKKVETNAHTIRQIKQVFFIIINRIKI